MKQRRTAVAGASIMAALAIAAQGQTLFNSTSAGYSAGNLAGQNNWAKLLNVGTNGIPYPAGQSNQLGQIAFNVDNSTWVETASTAADFLTTTNGSFAYLNETSAGNALDQVWTTTMDFNLSVPNGGPSGISMPNAEFFYVGLTAATNGTLSEYDRNDLCFIMRVRAEYGRLDLNLQDGDDANTRILQVKPEQMGWAPEAALDLGAPTTADYQTDDLRLTMTLRKTRNADTYTGSAILSNLNSGITVSGIFSQSNRVISTSFSTNFYAASNVKIAMGRTAEAHNTQFTGNGLIDIDVNALSVVKSTVPPVLAAPQNVNASPYDGQVTLAWDAVDEIGSYNVLRSTSMGGPYATITNLTGLGLVDTAVVNGTTYYYVIQSVFPGAGTADSLEVFAKPQLISSGTLIDTDFSFYSNGDLAGQNSWLPVSGSSNNAFNVINAGTVTAAVDTVSTAASFSTNVGNAVYLDKLTDNAVYDAWEGHIDFQVSSAWTNINNQDVLVFGVTADPTAPLFLQSNDNMALMSLKVRSNGKLVAMFGDENNDAENTRLAVLIGQGETGWDPANGDLLSDVIRYNWKIRKSGVDGTYQAFGSFSNMTQSVTNPAQTGVAFLTKVKQGMYDNPSANFAMGHYYKAKLSSAYELVNVTIFDMSVTHTSDNLPTQTAPTGLAALGADRTVTLSWDEAFEATSFDVLFAETSGGPQITLANQATTGYVDTPRFNNVTNYYSVRANYPLGSAVSAEIPGLPFASIKQIDWFGDQTGGKDNISTGQFAVDQTTGLTTNGGMMYIDRTSTPLLSTSINAKYENVPLYAIVQNNSVGVDISGGKGVSGFEVQTKDSNGLASDDVDLWANTGKSMNMLAYIEAADWSETQTPVDITQDTHSVTLANKLMTGTLRLAIRNNGQWYVHQTAIANGSANIPAGKLTIGNLYDENWAAVNISADTLFPNPGAFNKNNNASFTSVDAIGWYWIGAVGGRLKVYELTYSASGSIPSIDFWAGNNSVTNLYGNNDGDALINLKEYAFGGNPNDENDVGTLPNYTIGTYGGTNGFFVVHVELRDPAPGVDYSLETATDLAFPVWGAEGTVVGEANVDYYFKAVTNFIPADVAAKFIDLKVNEL